MLERLDLHHHFPTLRRVTSTPRQGSERPAVIRLIGVYDTEGTIRGEVAYWVGARLGRRHCSLCDVTHGTFSEKTAWKRCRTALPVPFDTFHRDDRPDEIRFASGDRTPVVLAETTAGMVLLLIGSQIDDAQGDPERLIAAIESAVSEAGLAWPE